MISQFEKIMFIIIIIEQKTWNIFMKIIFIIILILIFLILIFLIIYPLFLLIYLFFKCFNF